MNSNTEKIEAVEDNLVCLTATPMMTWEIPKFSELPDEDGYSVKGPSFPFENATYRLRLYPNVQKNEDGYVGFVLERLSAHVSRHELHCKITIKGEEVFSVNSLAVFVFDEDYHYEEGAERVEIICQYETVTEGDYPLTIDDVLTLKYQVFSEGPAVVDCCKTGILGQHVKDVECLRHDFKDLLANGKDHDVILKVKGKEFSAHQNVLRARSPVLKSMLSHDMVEKSSGVVDIPDCDPCAFEQFLIYLYCGEVETLDASNMLALYYLADKYDVGCLKERCRSFMKTSMSCPNVSEVIQLAMDHSDADLLERATDYFVKNVNKILSTVKWQCFIKLYPIQANELFIKAAKKMNAGKV